MMDSLLNVDVNEYGIVITFPRCKCLTKSTRKRPAPSAHNGANKVDALESASDGFVAENRNGEKKEGRRSCHKATASEGGRGAEQLADSVNGLHALHVGRVAKRPRSRRVGPGRTVPVDREEGGAGPAAETREASASQEKVVLGQSLEGRSPASQGLVVKKKNKKKKTTAAEAEAAAEAQLAAFFADELMASREHRRDEDDEAGGRDDSRMEDEGEEDKPEEVAGRSMPILYEDMTEEDVLMTVGEI